MEPKEAVQRRIFRVKRDKANGNGGGGRWESTGVAVGWGWAERRGIGWERIITKRNSRRGVVFGMNEERNGELAGGDVLL